jgi:hypothetical protein
MWMRIPTSTLVMSLVAAVPFGLAIRDTILHRDKLHEIAEADRQDRERRAAERAADESAQALYMQQLEQERQAREERVRQHASLLVGHDFVTPGLAYQGEELGHSKLDGVDTIVDANGNVLAMTATMTDDDVACSVLRDVASKTWGEPATDRVWLDLRAHHRASITPDCGLEFGRFAEPQAWVKDLPLDAVGKTRVELARRFASNGDPDPDGAWFMPGLDGDGLSRMWPIFDVAHPDKLIGLQIVTPATSPTIDRVVQQLATRLGAKPVHREDGAYIWRKPIAMKLEVDDATMFLELGPDALR